MRWFGGKTEISNDDRTVTDWHESNLIAPPVRKRDFTARKLIDAATGAQELQAVSLEDGTQKWRFAGNYQLFPILNRQNGQEFLPVTDILVATDTNGLVGITPKTGSVVWKWANDVLCLTCGS